MFVFLENIKMNDTLMKGATHELVSCYNIMSEVSKLQTLVWLKYFDALIDN